MSHSLIVKFICYLLFVNFSHFIYDVNEHERLVLVLVLAMNMKGLT